MSYNGCRMRYTITGMANLEVDCGDDGYGGGYEDGMGKGGSQGLWMSSRAEMEVSVMTCCEFDEAPLW